MASSSQRQATPLDPDTDLAVLSLRSLGSLAQELSSSWDAMDDPTRDEALKRLASACSSAQRSGRGPGLYAGPSAVPGYDPVISAREAREHIDSLVRHLTPREREVMDAIRAGASTSEIASQFGISRDTVRSHVRSVLTKLQVHSRLEAALILAHL
jgi:RNA polymerase sigma factor (sigma-70 family)